MPWWLGSRFRVILVVLGLLLLLDLGRSVYARLGYARPMEIWQPVPTVYADLTWPPGADLPSDAPRGQRIYAQRCAACHGPDGLGNTTLQDAKGYPVITRDLTAPWTFRGGSQPQQIWLRLTTGMTLSPMPSLADATTPEERWDLVNYVLSRACIPHCPGGTALTRAGARRAAVPSRTIGGGGTRRAPDPSLTPWVRRRGRSRASGGLERLEPALRHRRGPVLSGGGGGHLVS